MLKVVGASWFQTRVSTCIVGAVFALGVLAIILGEIDKEEDDGIYSATVFWHEEAGFHIDFWGQGNELDEIPYGVGRAYYKQDIDTTGWAVLEVETRPEYPDWVQAYAAGLLEGSLTWQLIYWHWLNTVQDICSDREEFCDRVYDFIEENSDWLKATAENNENKDPFWHQVHLFYVQLDGLETGWRHGVKRSRQEIDISHRDFLWMNIVSDLADMEKYFNNTLEDVETPFMFSAAASFSSAFVKFQADTRELYAAHNTGGLYQSMLRMLKRYQFGYHFTSAVGSKLVPGQTITFSSYPGVIHSQDDFYLVMGDPEFGKKQHQLAVLGTALNAHNKSFYGKLDPEEQVLIGPRVMAANRIAQDGRFWGRYLARANSGTGSKQWLIVDYGQIANTERRHFINSSISTTTASTNESKSSFEPKEQQAVPAVKERKGLIWIVEQLPGFMHSADQTLALLRKGSWVSNGYPVYQDKSSSNGRAATQENNPPSFQQDLTKTSDLTSVMQLMRNNTFLSNSHFVQKATNFNSSSHFPVPIGTIDSKIFHASPFHNVELYVTSGPVNSQNIGTHNITKNGNFTNGTVFQWSKSRFANETHIGLPDVLHFDFLQPEWVWF